MMLGRSFRVHLRAALRMRNYASVTQAAVYDRNGAPADVLQLQDIAVGPAGDDKVLLEMLAAPINPSDVNQIEGKYPISPDLPAVAGNEGVGVVRQVGSKVQRLSEGDWVVPLVAGQGTWRRFGLFSAQDWHPVPSTLPLQLAASLAVNPVSALRMLEEYAKLKEGDTVIQNGANSSVGRAVIQLAKVKGVYTVNVVRDRPNLGGLKEDLGRLGAALVTTEQQLKADLKASGLPLPVLGLNCVGGSSSTAIAKALGHGSTLVTYGGMSMKPVTLPTSLFIFKDLRAQGFWLSGNDRADASRQRKAAAVDAIVNLALDGHFDVTATAEVPFSDILSAFQSKGTSKQKQIIAF